VKEDKLMAHKVKVVIAHPYEGAEPDDVVEMDPDKAREVVRAGYGKYAEDASAPKRGVRTEAGSTTKEE
jgi:hypothetical protein